MGSFDIYASVGTEGRFRAIVGSEASWTDLQWSPSSATRQAQLNLCHFVQPALKKNFPKMRFGTFFRQSLTNKSLI